MTVDIMANAVYDASNGLVPLVGDIETPGRWVISKDEMN
jgi:hypothetical protein